MTDFGRIDRLSRTPDYLAIARQYLGGGAAAAMKPETESLEPDPSQGISPAPSDYRATDELLRVAGDLATEVNAHLAACRTCRLEYYVTDNPAPLCRKGLELRRRYRDARRVAPGSDGTR